MRHFRLHTRLRNAILGVALLLGQWLALAHAFEHPAIAPEQVCQICLQGQGHDPGALASALAALPEFGTDAFDASAPVAAVGLRRPSHYRARAPPAILV